MKVFVSYSRKDSRWVSSDGPHAAWAIIPFLADSLQSLGVQLWIDREGVQAGDLYRERIRAAINESSIAILLISQNFLNSQFIQEEELPCIRERAETNQLEVIPILVGSCEWKRLEFLEQRQILPAEKPRPLITFVDDAKEWDRVQSGILRSIEAIVRKRLDHREGPVGPDEDATRLPPGITGVGREGEGSRRNSQRGVAIWITLGILACSFALWLLWPKGPKPPPGDRTPTVPIEIAARMSALSNGLTKLESLEPTGISEDVEKYRLLLREASDSILRLQLPQFWSTVNTLSNLEARIGERVSARTEAMNRERRIAEIIENAKTAKAESFAPKSFSGGVRQYEEGTKAYQSGDFEQAMRAFDESVQSLMIAKERSSPFAWADTATLVFTTSTAETDLKRAKSEVRNRATGAARILFGDEYSAQFPQDVYNAVFQRTADDVELLPNIGEQRRYAVKVRLNEAMQQILRDKNRSSTNRAPSG